jgi:hypothetical protein
MKKLFILTLILTISAKAFCQTDKDDINTMFEKTINTMFKKDAMRKSDSITY